MNGRVLGFEKKGYGKKGVRTFKEGGADIRQGAHAITGKRLKAVQDGGRL